jgi:ParB family chromosome partitioning protein
MKAAPSNKFNKNINNKLGQGISALISAEKHNSRNILYNNLRVEVVDLEIDKIKAGSCQPRYNFNENDLEELAQSIKENDVIQPIIVRPIDEKEGKYEIIAGERRFRASKIANLKTIPAIIKKLNNHQALEMALIENIQRSELSVIEEAKGFKRLSTDFSYNQEHIARKVGKSRSHVANLMRLLSLPESVQSLVDDNLITMGHARALINCSNAEEVAHLILEKSLTVRDVENIANNKIKLKPIQRNSAETINEIEDMTKIINNLSNMDAKIKYNNAKNTGQITLKFKDLALLKNLIQILQNDNKSQ